MDLKLPLRNCVLALAIALLGGAASGAMVGAQEAENAPSVEAIVTEIVEESRRDVAGRAMEFQVLQLKLASGPHSGQDVVVEVGDDASSGVPRYAVGDRLLVAAQPRPDGSEVYYIEDRIRRTPLTVLLALFVSLVLIVARWRGLASLLALGISFAAIFLFLLPRISAGDNPILAAIGTSLVIIPTSYYLSHGLNRKTHAAVIGTLVSLAFAGILAVVAVDAAVITGFASEEASYVDSLRPGVVNIRGLLLASIIIGLSGILDDITISQSAIVAQLREAGAEMSLREVYARAMDIGRDHIASLVNTLIMVYASSALPLLLLFTYSDVPWRDVVNYEIVAEEIVRTLVASIGLILAVPITTALACLMLPTGSNDNGLEQPHALEHHRH